jgi:putative restriction endonuclease
VRSGGYEDDVDAGDTITYTGHGGRDPVTRRQVADQVLTRGNLALARSRDLGLPVRVVRGPDANSPYAPPSGYRYDGLYAVDDYWAERGRSRFRVIRFRLIKIRDDEGGEALRTRDVPSDSVEMDVSDGKVKRVRTTTQRIVRDTVIGRRIKELYQYRCQICRTTIVGPSGPYAEAAHIRPLGEPHRGPDSADNLLCLCPNHHVMFDMGAFSIADDHQS